MKTWTSLKNTLRSWVCLLFVPLGLNGCAGPTVKDYQDQKPVLILEQYLSGKLQAWGMFQGRDGTVKKRFTVNMVGTWKDGVGTLDEDFTWSDGTKSRRVWTIKKTATGQYEGTADDVVGKAIGEASGNAFRWRYVLSLPVDGKTYEVDFDDWMFLIDDKVMLNRSTMSKWGFHLGEVSLSFMKNNP